MLLGVEFYDAWKYVGIDAGVKAIKDAGFDTMDMSYQLDAADFFLGEDYIEKALERGVKVTGATVHFVDGGMDTGPIIAQKAVYVQPGDTPEVLQRRVMEEAEWLLLPQAIDDIANGRI